MPAPLLDSLARDLRYALRILRRSPGFTLTVLLTLTLAIGINTAVFSIVDAVLLRPLPYPQPKRLALVETSSTAPAERTTAQHGVTWMTIRDHATTVDRAVFSTWTAGVNVLSADRASHAKQQRVGSGFFRVLGISPIAGREFTPDEDRRGGPPAAILSDRLWRTTLGADPSIVGGTLTVRGEPHTIVGIMPPDFHTGVDADLWTPLKAGVDGEGEGENYHILLRLKEGTSWTQASEEIRQLGAEILRARPVQAGNSLAYSIVPLQSGLTESLRRPPLLLLSAVAHVLLLASVNLAGLMLTRGSRRLREITTRFALGGTRAALARQLAIESLLLAGIGALLGLAASVVLVDMLRSVAADALDLWQPVALEWRSAAAAAGLGLLAATIFGLAPALQLTRRSIAEGLTSSGTRAIAAGTAHWARRALVVTQVAAAVVLLVGAGLLLRTFAHLRGLDPGFDAGGVTAASISLHDARYATSAKVQQFTDAALRAAAADPRVEASAVSLGLPYERLLNLGFRHLDGPAAAQRGRMTSATYIAGDYFATLRIPVRQGRQFGARDTSSAPGVAIVNEAFTRQYFDGESALGRRIAFAGREREIVGVVGNVQVRPGWGDHGPLAAMPLAYIPLAQANDPTLRLVHGWFQTNVIVRARQGGGETESVLRNALGAADPQLPIASIRRIDEVQSAAIAQPRVMMTLLLALSAAAALLAAAGIYGLIAASVTERTREIGIRLALGSTAAGAVRLLATPGVVLAALGVLVGVLLARTAARLLDHFVWGVSRTDVTTFAAVAVFALAVAVVSSLGPALRILRLDPARTLRAE